MNLGGNQMKRLVTMVSDPRLYYSDSELKKTGSIPTYTGLSIVLLSG